MISAISLKLTKKRGWKKIIGMVREAQKGDKQIFLGIFQKFEEDLYRMVFVYTKNKEDALDIVQETAYKSFKNLHGLKEPQFYKNWLIKITISCLTARTDERKKEKANSEREINEPLI